MISGADTTEERIAEVGWVNGGNRKLTRGWHLTIGYLQANRS